MEAKHVPGLALGVGRGDQIIHEGYYGLANLEHGVAVRPETAFEIASVTKLFTSQAVLRLAQDGLLRLDASIAEYLPNLPDAWTPVTVRHCLAHQSGIPSYTAVERYWQMTRDAKSHEDVLALVRDLPLSFAPGTRHGYDNTGFYLLGMIIEAVTGSAYGAYLRDIIFEPLGMMQTWANDYAAVVPHRAQGYIFRDGALCNKAFYDTSNTFSAGILLSTVRDLLAWRASFHSDVVLDAPMRALWRTPHPSPAGNERQFNFTVTLGWFIVDHPLAQFYGHNGGIQGFASTFLHLPATDTTAVALYNSDQIAEPHQFLLETLRDLDLL